MAESKTNYYPNCDNGVWLRSCDVEVTEPLQGEVRGEIPSWLNGTLLRNGPGSLKVGSMRFKHLFDSAALLHRFRIQDGRATYQCRFLRSNTFKRNRAANRIVVTEFGTQAVPDPCHTIFDRVAALFKPGDSMSDNAMISLYPFGDQMYAFTEGPVIHRIDKETLDTVERKDLTDCVALVNHTSHPHVMPNGDVYNVGIVVRNQLSNQPLASSLKWYPEHKTHVVLISRRTGKEVKRYYTDTLFFLHIINCFEEDRNLIVDICAYKDAKVLDAMYIHAIESMQSNADYAGWFRSRPKRLEISLDSPLLTYVEPKLLADLGCETPRIHYALHNGRPYRYFYAISSDVDAEHPGLIIKVDTVTGETKTWWETDCYPSEPVFVPDPDAKEEDEGVILCALVFGKDECLTGLLVLDAVTLTELGRATFQTPSAAPKCLHGWFLPNSF
ncbi:jg21899 [Pararge aegeria aegeria]|uniref:Jg21899 protein n=1 Tax=Pararge aegeria aegeria TaxID=348720 RepID=A0A8S4RS61_9NEOP|nr:jg21899 [Pararge aegeria aegeria]